MNFINRDTVTDNEAFKRNIICSGYQKTDIITVPVYESHIVVNNYIILTNKADHILRISSKHTGRWLSDSEFTYNPILNIITFNSPLLVMMEGTQFDVWYEANMPIETICSDGNSIWFLIEDDNEKPVRCVINDDPDCQEFFRIINLVAEPARSPKEIRQPSDKSVSALLGDTVRKECESV